MKKVEEFTEKYKKEKFRHSEELFRSLMNEEYKLNSSPRVDQEGLPCEHYLRIYKIRWEHLKEFNTEYCKRILEDVKELCVELEKTPEENVELWSFAVKPHYDFTVFVSSTSNKVFGCILGVDRRLIGDKEWDLLWGK